MTTPGRFYGLAPAMVDRAKALATEAHDRIAHAVTGGAPFLRAYHETIDACGREWRQAHDPATAMLALDLASSTTDLRARVIQAVASNSRKGQ